MGVALMKHCNPIMNLWTRASVLYECIYLHSDTWNHV